MKETRIEDVKVKGLSQTSLAEDQNDEMKEKMMTCSARLDWDSVRKSFEILIDGPKECSRHTRV